VLFRSLIAVLPSRNDAHDTTASYRSIDLYPHAVMKLLTVKIQRILFFKTAS